MMNDEAAPWGAASVQFSRLSTSVDVSQTSARLAVLGVLAAGGAELGELEPVGVVTPVLLGDVVAVLAHRARHRDLRSDVLGLAGHGAAYFRIEASVESRPGAGTARATARPHTVFQRTRSAGHRSNRCRLRPGSGGGTRTHDTAIMSRLLYRLSYSAATDARPGPGGTRREPR